jgi:hypothetical protein
MILIIFIIPCFAIIMASGTEDVEERSLGDSLQNSFGSVEEQEESCVEESTQEGSEQYTDEQEVSMNEASDEDSECEGAKGGPPCEFCGQVPCDVDTFCTDNCEVCDAHNDNGLENNQVRFHAYRECTKLKHEILDSLPDPNCSYLGFQAAIKYAAED